MRRASNDPLPTRNHWLYAGIDHGGTKNVGSRTDGGPAVDERQASSINQLADRRLNDSRRTLCFQLWHDVADDGFLDNGDHVDPIGI